MIAWLSPVLSLTGSILGVLLVYRFWWIQRRYEMKRDAILRTIQALGAAQNALFDLCQFGSSANALIEYRPHGAVPTRDDLQLKWREQYENFQREWISLSFLVGGAVDRAIVPLSLDMKFAADNYLHPDSGLLNAIGRQIVEVQAIARKQLNIRLDS